MSFIIFLSSLRASFLGLSSTSSASASTERSKSSSNDEGAEARMALRIEGLRDSSKIATISSSGDSGRRRSARRYFGWRKMAVFYFSLCFLE